MHDNRNYIPYYNPTYGPNPDCYGNECQDYIIDGSGVYITRNKPGSEGQSATDYSKGWFYFANNITYRNGINGVVVHKSDRAIVTNNLAFLNGSVPLSEGRQNAGGIVIHTSENIYMYNNISWVSEPTDFTYQEYGVSSYTASNNIGIDGNSAFSPSEFTAFNSIDDLDLFVDTAARDFHLVENSIAKDLGFVHPDLPEFDFDGMPRFGVPDIGPYEADFSVKTNNINPNLNLYVYPNPVSQRLFIACKAISEIKIMNSLGQTAIHQSNLKETNYLNLEVGQLEKGVYFIVLQTQKGVVSKQFTKN